MQTPKPYLSVVVPLYNEEDNVKILFQELCSTIDLLIKPYEIIFVDDGSLDKTFKHLKEIKIEQESNKDRLAEIRIIRFSKNFGQTAAMQAGFDQTRGDIIVSLDGDLQNDPADIPRMVDKLKEGYGVVCGWRKNRKDRTFTRIIPSKIANWLIAKITGIPIHDLGCSLKVYRHDVIKSVRLYSDMHRFIPAMVAMVGARVTEMVVNHRSRKYGQTKYGLSRIWKVLFDMVTVKMLIHFYNRPILWFVSFGFLFLFCGIIMGAISVLNFLTGNWSVIHFTASILFIYIFVSLLFWGLLAEFFVKIEKKVTNLSVVNR
jgi:glycosyltransferase involved in cell wall biosynthesis